MEVCPYFYAHSNFEIILLIIGLLALSWYTFYLILLNVGIWTLFLYTFEFCHHPSKDWNSAPIFFSTFEFWPYLYTHQNSYLILANVRILALFLQTLEFLSNLSTANIEILTLSLQTLEFRPIIYTHWNSAPIFINILIPVLSFFPWKHWFSGLFLQNIGILALFL